MTTNEGNSYQNEAQYSNQQPAQPVIIPVYVPPPPMYFPDPAPLYNPPPQAVQLSTDNKPAKSNQNTHRDFGSHR